jgi:hypothetical protein
VTEDAGRFDQPADLDWEPFVQSFDTTGDYPYYCTVHGNVGGVGMAGTLRVGAALPPPPASPQLRLPQIRVADE